MARDIKRISAIIACYRAEPAVPIMHARLTAVFQKLGVDYEIIFVNDCSPDNAAAVLRDLAARDERVVVINHTRNFGSQSAFTSGMAIATGDAAVLLDGDLQDPPEVIPDLVRRWSEGFDVVYAVRRKRKEGILKRSGYALFYRLLRSISSVEIAFTSGVTAILIIE